MKKRKSVQAPARDEQSAVTETLKVEDVPALDISRIWAQSWIESFRRDAGQGEDSRKPLAMQRTTGLAEG